MVVQGAERHGDAISTWVQAHRHPTAVSSPGQEHGSQVGEKHSSPAIVTRLQTGAEPLPTARYRAIRPAAYLGCTIAAITQKTYAHLAPEAWHQDYHRLAFHMPTEPARVFAIVRDHRGKLAGRRAITVDARETAILVLVDPHNQTYPSMS